MNENIETIGIASRADLPRLAAVGEWQRDVQTEVLSEEISA